MRTRFAILMALVMAVAIGGVLYATNRTVEADPPLPKIERIEVTAGVPIPGNRTVHRSDLRCEGAASTVPGTMPGRDGVKVVPDNDGNYEDSVAVGGETVVYDPHRTYPYKFFVGFIVRGYDTAGKRVCIDYTLVRLTVKAPVAAAAPGAPTSFVQVGDSTVPPISFSWTAPSPSDSILGYVVHRIRLSDYSTTAFTTTAPKGTFPASFNTRYKWEVRARNSKGVGVAATTTVILTTTLAPTPTPTPVPPPPPPVPVPPPPSEVKCYYLHMHPFAATSGCVWVDPRKVSNLESTLSKPGFHEHKQSDDDGGVGHGSH